MNPAVIALLLLPTIAQAQIYKCVAADGTTSYATIPCPEGTGETTRIIEPIPPSGVLTIPHNEQTPENTAPTAPDTKPSGPTVTGVLTVIPDSEDPRREQKREEMREDAAQHKRDLYEDFARQQEEMSRKTPVQQPQQPQQPQQ